MIINTFFIPKNFKTSIVNKKKNFLFLKDSFIKIIIPIYGFLKININSHTMLNKNLFCIKLLNFFKSYSIINLQNIKFKGKGYKLTKKENVLNFLFNFSHITYFVCKNSILKKLTKNKFLIINWDFKKLNILKRKIVDKRYINIYNYNGLRLKRQFIYKRKGKTITS